MELHANSMKLIEVYRGYNPTQVEGIFAAIGSALLAIGGIFVAVLSGGTATPLLIGMGMAGVGGSSAIQASIQTSQNRFDIMDFTQDFLIEAGTTVLTFGTGAAVGGLIVKKVGTALSANAVKALAVSGGAFGGAVVRDGKYVIVRVAEGEEIQAWEVVLEGLQGALEGGTAGFVMAKTGLSRGIPADEETLLATRADNLAYTEVRSNVKAEVFVFRQRANSLPGNFGSKIKPVVIESPQEILATSRITPNGLHILADEPVLILRGQQLGNHQGFGITHILKQHPEVASALNVQPDDFRGAAKELASLLRRDIEGYQVTGNYAKAVYKHPVTQKYLAISVSDKHWSFGKVVDASQRAIIQVNRVEKRRINFNVIP